jgi:hypothetical protein
VPPAAIDVYVASFVARCNVMGRPGRPEVDEPGIHGLLSSTDDPLTRLLVTDDRASDVLAALLPDAREGVSGDSLEASCLRWSRGGRRRLGGPLGR